MKKPIKISYKEYRDKVFACWLGKNIGGTLGAPYEGKKFVNCLDYYSPIPEKSAQNDDLDLQLIWLKMLEDKGINPSLQDFAEYWKKYASAYPWNEYGMLQRNLKRGLLPPITGCFENYFIDEMGAPIRSEIWACLAPGDPQLASSMAWKDAVIDHAGGEGMYGEMFWAGVESAAFIIDNPEILIRIGLEMIPLHSMVARAAREALYCFKNGISWAEAREQIAIYYGHHQVCYAPVNIGFTILGWLYGNNFGDKLCKAVNCGFDTDCTGATLGALLGIIGGVKGIPQKWQKPIGLEIVTHPFTGKFNVPKTIGELTERISKLSKHCIEEKSNTVEFSEKTNLPENILSLLFRNEKAISVLRRDTHSSVIRDGNIEVTLHYYGEPVIRPEIEKLIGISLQSETKRLKQGAEIQIKVPEGWCVSPYDEGAMRHKRFIIKATVGSIDLINKIGVNVVFPSEVKKLKFVILGQEEATGWQSGKNIESCKRCGGWIEACICKNLIKNLKV